MDKFNQYVANVGSLVKSLLKGEGKEWKKGNILFSKISVGICCSYQFFGIPFFTLQFNPNFKEKLYFFGLPLLTWKRIPLTLKKGFPYQEENSRKRRIYIHIGGLPYFDNNSGIPRVAKKLSEEGLKNPDIEVYPVYPDPKDGTYRIALEWIHKKKYTDPLLNGMAVTNYSLDPPITIRDGDWFIHTMINPNELEFEKAHLQAMRRFGVKIGFILHDIIAERHPEYFKKRDSLNFSQWLRMIGDYDGVFAVSKATLNDYKSWRQEQGLPKASYPLEWFHLGADFKYGNGKLTQKEESQLLQIRGKEYYIQVSTIEPRKGYAQLLDAFELLWKEGCDLCLIIVGRKGWLVEDLCRRIKKHPLLNTKLFWFYGISDNLLAVLYKQAKGVIVASENEGFGLSVAEGAFYGKTLLLRNIPVFREIAGDNAFYFDGFDGLSLSKKILEMNKAITKGQTDSQKVTISSWFDCLDSIRQLLR